MNSGLYLSDVSDEPCHLRYFQVCNEDKLSNGYGKLSRSLEDFFDNPGRGYYPDPRETYKQLTPMNLVRWDNG